jgi:ABC-type phosphate/phosphonate transport system substrate-binding protein
MGVASMPMYDMPEVRTALDSLWNGFAHNLRREGVTDVPEELVHDRPLCHLWNDPELWFSQCCGYDLVNGYAEKLTPIATPHYGAPGCEGCDYASVIVVRDDYEANDVLEMRGAVCVINGPESHSGMNALRALVAPVSCGGRFFAHGKVSGTHVDSLEMIKRGEADVAAIDCVTYALLERHRPATLSGIRKLGRTDRAPGIPYVTRSTVAKDTVARMRTALFRTFDDPHLTTVRQTLLLEDVEEIHLSHYERITEFQQTAVSHGYPELT